MFSEYTNQMLRMLLSDVFDTKVVDHECEGYWAIDMLPQAWDKFGLEVSVLVQSLLINDRLALLDSD